MSSVEVPMTRGRLVHASDPEVFVDLPADGPLSLVNEAAGLTYLYPLEYDGLPADGVDFYPPTPEGAELVGLRPYVVGAYTTADQVPIEQDTTFWGEPPPTLSPYLATNPSGGVPLTIEALPTGTPSGQLVCQAEVAPADQQFEAALTIQKADPDDLRPSVEIVVAEFGWSFIFSSSAVDVLVQAELITQEKA